MSTLKAGAMLSLFPGYAFHGAAVSAPQRDAAGNRSIDLPVIDLISWLSVVRRGSAAVGLIARQAADLMPNVFRATFCGR